MNKKKITFILNPISGTVSKAGIPDLIEERLDKDRFEYCIAETSYAGHATELAKEAAKDGIDIVVAVGRRWYCQRSWKSTNPNRHGNGHPSVWLWQWTCQTPKPTHEP